MHILKVDGMTCGGCVRSITQVLKKIDDKADVQVDLASKTVKVKSDKALEIIKKAIQEAGFQVTN